MSVNKEKPHVSIIPEDDANRQIINGFCNDYNVTSKIEIQPIASGWSNAVEKFENIEIDKLRKYPHRHLVLVIDFDTQSDRLSGIKGKIPKDLQDRVFIIGSWDEAEKLKNRRSYETIGEGLATDCYENTDEFWNDGQLQHNFDELERLRRLVKPIIFEN